MIHAIVLDCREKGAASDRACQPIPPGKIVKEILGKQLGL
jgi:hypothetical protein